MLRAVVFLACSLLMGSPAAHSPLMRSLSRGEIVFSNYTVYAEGTALPTAGPRMAVRVQTQRAAEETAAANLIASASGIIVSADTTVADLAAVSAFHRGLLASFAKYALVSVRFHTNESVTVRLSVPLLGKDNLIARARESLLLDAQARSGVIPPIVQAEAGTNFTSLIIDARDVNPEPALFPAVYDDTGMLLYGVAFADGAAVIKHGLVSYISASGMDHDHVREVERLRELHALSRALRPVLLERDMRKKERGLESFAAGSAKQRWAKDVAQSIDRTMQLRTSVNNKVLAIDESIKREVSASEKKLKNSRWGYAPYYAVAWRIRGAKRCDIVIAPDDGRVILGNRSLASAMKDCRVGIIID